MAKKPAPKVEKPKDDGLAHRVKALEAKVAKLEAAQLAAGGAAADILG